VKAPKGVEGQAFKGSASRTIIPPEIFKNGLEKIVGKEFIGKVITEKARPRPIAKDIHIVEYIDYTPTWEEILLTWLAVLRDGNEDSRWNAEEELLRMARAADRWNAHCKEMKGE